MIEQQQQSREEEQLREKQRADRMIEQQQQSRERLEDFQEWFDQRRNMAEFTKTYTVNCPDCEGDHVVKMGIRNGQQRYLCRGCKKALRTDGKAKGMRMDSELVGSAIRDYYTGKSYKQIAEGLKEEYDLPKEPSKATIYEWVRDYTTKALKELGRPQGQDREGVGSR